nr:hypothetical protein [Tanacetum cinerariifolium]
MSSSNHPTSDIKDAFSSNSPNYTPALPDYSPASPGNTPSESLNDSYGLVPIASPTLSIFHDNPYMKVMHAYDAIIPPQVLILAPIIVPLSPMLSPIFNPQEFFIPEELFPPKKQTHLPSPSSTDFPIHLGSKPKMEERLVNGWIIIPKYFDEVKTKLKEAHIQILELLKKHIGQKDKIAFVHFRISDLEMTLEDIQDCHQSYVKNLMGHNS